MTTSRNPLVPQQPSRLAHVALVLDRSGSMEACRDATISGFNEYVDHLRTTAHETDLHVLLTLTVFNQEVRMPLFQASLDDLRPLSPETYVPGGTTAMLDGVGRTIDRLERRGRAMGEASVLVCIVSDGLENASREYTRAALTERIRRLMTTQRWTLSYLGANQDLSRVAHDLSIPLANMASYQATPGGTGDAWRTQREATARRMRAASRGERASRDFYNDDPDGAKR